MAHTHEYGAGHSQRKRELLAVFERHARRELAWPNDVEFYQANSPDISVDFDDSHDICLWIVDEGYGTRLFGRAYFDGISWSITAAVFIGDDDDEFRIIPQEDIKQ
jgi:hypothetical protein